MNNLLSVADFHSIPQNLTSFFIGVSITFGKSNMLSTDEDMMVWINSRILMSPRPILVTLMKPSLQERSMKGARMLRDRDSVMVPHH